MHRTQVAFIGIRILGTPCWTLLSMLVFILYKNLSLSPLQITLIIALKPMSALLSPYWSQAIHGRPDRLFSNLLAANLLRHLPFVFFPWISSTWFAIIAFGLYMTLSRATIPAWLELFKHHLPQKTQAKVISYGTMIDYIGTAILAIWMGITLDRYPEIGKYLFSYSALLGILSTLLLFFLSPTPSIEKEKKPPLLPSLSCNPWKQVWTLLQQRKDFSLFQMGFLLGGAGLMIMQPALPSFFIDTLHLSFTEMGVAIALCKALGIVVATPFWTRFFQKRSIFMVSATVTLFATLFPVFLLATPLHISLLYIAYLLYGIMQAGSELSWHLSSLTFSKEKDSSLFSTTNVFTVGIRGCVIPLLGSLLLPGIHPSGLLILGALLCLSASIHFFYYRQPQSA